MSFFVTPWFTPASMDQSNHWFEAATVGSFAVRIFYSLGSAISLDWILLLETLGSPYSISQKNKVTSGQQQCDWSHFLISAKHGLCHYIHWHSGKSEIQEQKRSQWLPWAGSRVRGIDCENIFVLIVGVVLWLCMFVKIKATLHLKGMTFTVVIAQFNLKKKQKREHITNWPFKGKELFLLLFLDHAP